MHLHKMQPTTIIKASTSLNPAVPFSGDNETNLYMLNTLQFK